MVACNYLIHSRLGNNLITFKDCLKIFETVILLNLYLNLSLHL